MSDASSPVPDPGPDAAPDPASVPFDAGVAPAPAQPPKRTGRTIAIVVAAVVGGVVLLAGGAVAAFVLLSGRGPQPDVAMPADTLGYVNIDLDPSAGQKVNLVRFLSSNIPADSDLKVDPNSEDPLGDLIDSSGMLDGSGVTWSEIDAWLGDRAAVAALPGNGDEPVPIVLVRVDDEEAMKAFFAKQDADVAYGMVREGYAVLAEDQAVVSRVVGSTAWLSEDPGYKYDVEQLGTGQIVAGWIDVAEASSIGTDLVLGSATSVPATGHVIFGLTAEPSMLELSAVGTGLTIDGEAIPALASSNGLSTLPQGTVAGLSLANPGEWITEGLRIARERDQGFVIDDFTSATGLTEEQVIGLLSTTITAFVMKNPDGLDETPLVGVRLVETDASNEQAWQDALDSAGVPVAVDTVAGAGGTSYVYLRATDTADVLDQVNAAKGTLADDPAFAQVVPSDATMSVFVDMSTVWDYLRQNDPEQQTLDDITAVGMSMTASGGDPSVLRMSVRVAFDGTAN